MIIGCVASYKEETKRLVFANLMRGTLLSSDIIELEEAAKSKLPLDILNPVNRLSGPVLDRGTQEERLVFQESKYENRT